ncbi:MAG: hypothetical protein LBV76_03755, partial [Deltaproteobacteria bacterium]|nr:hypothetical protein [Deltaproteobacteria bacterium]
MRKILLLLLAVACLGMTYGCSHITPITSIEGVKVYSSFEERIPGKFAIVVNANESDLNRYVQPSSFACSAWSYPLVFYSSFKDSIIK